MRLSGLVGYDGPIRVWLDGKGVFDAPEGTNPATPYDGDFTFAAGVGVHRVLIALGTNKGRAWGVFLRLERKDLNPRVVAKGPEYYEMPKLLG